MKPFKNSPVVVTINGTSVIIFGIVLSLIFIVLFFIYGIFYSFKYDYEQKATTKKGEELVDGTFLFTLVSWENHAFLEALPNDTLPSLAEGMLEISANINLNDPRSLLRRELPSFSFFDGKIIVAGEGTDYTNLPIESPPPEEVLKEESEASLQNVEKIEESEEKKLPVPPSVNTGDKKKVYIYFSHTRESFLPYLKGVNDPNKAHHSKINVTKIGDYLKERLEDYGIGTIVDKTDVMELLNKNGLTYGRSYDQSRKVVEAALMENRDLTYLIDIHRDSQRKEKTTKKINGKNYAKLAFVIGAENPNYEQNLELAYELHKKLEEKYPGLSRGIIEKKGAHTNGKFNQDLSENALLIEFGGVDNSFEELYRSADAFSECFSEIFWNAEPVNVQTKEKASKH